MAALNFPDPNVTTSYTNPDTGITYEWSNNVWKAVRSAQTAPELFVNAAGDNITGNLTFGTDKIVLNATTGAATFASAVEATEFTVNGSPIGGAGSQTLVSDTMPTPGDYEVGTMWWNSESSDTSLYVLYQDPTGPNGDAGGKYWIEASPAPDSIGFDGTHTGNSTFTGNMNVTGNLDVDGHTELDDLNVAGISTFNNNVNVDGGDITFQSQGDKLIFSNSASNPASGGCIEIKTSATSTATIRGSSNQLLIFNDDDSSQSIDLRAATYSIEDENADYYALFYQGACRLYHPATNGGINDQKLETTGSGINITGNTETDTLNVTGVSTFNGDVTLPYRQNLTLGDGLDDSGEFRIYNGANQPFQIFGSSKEIYIRNTGSNAHGINISANASVTLGGGGSSGFSVWAASDGSAKLLHSTQEKLTTTSGGINITGNTETDTLNVTGISTFTGNMNVTGNASFASQVSTSDRFDSNRTTGTDNVFNGRLNDSLTSSILANGSAEFGGNIVRKYSDNEYISIGNDANDVLRYRTDGSANGQKVLISKDGSTMFAGNNRTSGTSFISKTTSGHRHNLISTGYFINNDANNVSTVALFADGSATFAGDLMVSTGNSVTSTTDGGTYIGNFGQIVVNAASDTPADSRVFLGKNKNVQTSEINADGSATFGGYVKSIGFSCVDGVVNNGGVNLSAGRLDIRQDGSNPVIQLYHGSNTNVSTSLNGDGSATFKGVVDVTSSTYSFIGRRSSDDTAVFAVDNTGLMNIGLVSGSDSNIVLNGSNGSATFAGGVVATGDDISSGITVNTTAAGKGVAVLGSSGGDIRLKGDSSATFGSPSYGNGAIGTWVHGNGLFNSAGIQVFNQSTNPNYTMCYSAYGVGANNRVAWIGNTGAAYFAGNITAGNVSDIKFKENIEAAPAQLSDIEAFELKTFDWKDEAPLSDELKAQRKLGLIAQEVEAICPEMVYEVPGQDDDSYKAINHDVLIMKLLGAVKELAAKVAALEAN